MKDSFRIGLGFGLTSAVITTLGLMVGLYATTSSKLVVIGGVLSIAIADALSDAMGIHVSQEFTKQSFKKVWESTIATFLSKFIFALTFLVPILLLELKTAITTSICWGFILIISSTLLLDDKKHRIKAMIEHSLMAVVVIIITYFVGRWISTFFA